MTDKEYLKKLRIPTSVDPLRILMSACLAGSACGYNATTNGEYPATQKLLGQKTIKIIHFCPEEFSFGVPREMCDIHGGTGFDVLDGKAKVLSASGKDWSEGMIKAAYKMLETARSENIELAVLMDISAACGSQVIYEGNRFAENKVYQIGAGVCSALLLRNGVRVISQRDFASLEILYAKMDPDHQPDQSKTDHHETDWYKSYFGK